MSDEYQFPNKDFTTPAEPLVNGKPYSGLKPEEREIAFDSFRADWARAVNRENWELEVNAGSAQKKFSSYKEFLAEKEKYDNNPLNAEVQRLKAGHKNAYDSMGKEEADKWLQGERDTLSTGYMNALDMGAKDPKVAAGQKTAMQQLFQLPPNIMGAAQAFIMTMPPVAAFLRSMWSGFTGEKISYEDARKEMRIEEAYNGLAAKGFGKPEEVIARGKQVFAQAAAAPTAAAAEAPAAPMEIVIGNTEAARAAVDSVPKPATPVKNTTTPDVPPAGATLPRPAAPVPPPAPEPGVTPP